MPTMTVRDAAGDSMLVARVASTGQTVAADSLPVVPASDVAAPVQSARSRFRDNFFTFDTTNNWEVLQTGTGQTITTDGVTGGSRYLAITTGTTVSDETVIVSRQSFTVPIELNVAVSISSRIVNQNFYVELVSVDANGDVETDTTFSSTESSNATNAVGFRWSTTSSTNAFPISVGYGVSELVGSSTGYGTTAATGSSPNFLAATQFLINLDADQITWSGTPVNTQTVVPSFTKRTVNVPDASKRYKVRLRVKNGTTAPASSQTFRVHMVSAQSLGTVVVDPSRTSGRADLADAQPVLVVTPDPVQTQPTAVALTGGLSNYRLVASGPTTNAAVVKASAGRVYSIIGWNAGGTARYLKLYNKATAPTVGTDTPVYTFFMPPSQQFVFDFSGLGSYFATGIGVAITAGSADTDTAAIAANDILGLNIGYA